MLFIAIVQDTFGQGCGTEASAEQIKYVNKSQTKARSFNSKITRGITDVPIQIHVLRRSNGGGGIAQYRINEALNDLNSFFVEANIRFIPLKKINYINSDEHYDFNVQNEDKLGKLHDVGDVINLYIANSISSGQISLCGYAYFPPGNDRVMMSKSCINNGSTLPHEMGHYFMLYHTHGTSNNGTTDELVNGKNCHMAGDRVCDTPADPNISGLVSGSCQYVGRSTDKNGGTYNPDPLNMMSYSTKACRQKFTRGQLKRMNYAILNHRDYLKFPSNKKKEPALTGNLSGSLILEIADRPLPTKLDKNLFRSREGYYSGTNFQLYIANKQTAYVYVIASNLKHDMGILFPLEGQQAMIKAGEKKFALPGDDYMYNLDNTRGRDYICVLYSKKPLDIEKVLKDMKGTKGNFMQKMYKSLGKHLVPLNQINYKQRRAIEFAADAGKEYIVPIVVEIKHL